MCGARAGWVLPAAPVVCVAVVKTRSRELETEVEIARKGLGKL